MGPIDRTSLAGVFLCTFLAIGGTAPAWSETETELTVPGPSGPLSGTLLRADGSNPSIVLIIPGSGPIDRDGNGPNGLNTDTYRLIAEGLKDRGISSVRIDKRGLFKSNKATDDPDRVSLDIYAADVRSWKTRILETTGTPCLWLLGHSEGGLVAINHAAATPEGICGVLLAAVPGRPLADVLRTQLAQNPANAPILEQANQIIAELEAGNRAAVAQSHPALRLLFRPGVQGFWIDLFSFNAPDALSAFDGPVLVLQGTKDVQVSLADAIALSPPGSTAQRLLLEDANHILKEVATTDYLENLRTYTDPGVPLHPTLVQSIADFVDANRRSR